MTAPEKYFQVLVCTVLEKECYSKNTILMLGYLHNKKSEQPLLLFASFYETTPSFD